MAHSTKFAPLGTARIEIQSGSACYFCMCCLGWSQPRSADFIGSPGVYSRASRIEIYEFIAAEPYAPAPPAIALWLPSPRPAGRVAEFGSLGHFTRYDFTCTHHESARLRRFTWVRDRFCDCGRLLVATQPLHSLGDSSWRPFMDLRHLLRVDSEAGRKEVKQMITTHHAPARTQPSAVAIHASRGPGR